MLEAPQAMCAENEIHQNSARDLERQRHRGIGNIGERMKVLSFDVKTLCKEYTPLAKMTT